MRSWGVPEGGGRSCGAELKMYELAEAGKVGWSRFGRDLCSLRMSH